MNKRSIGAIATLIMLGGCAMAPDYQPPESRLNSVYLNQGAQGTTTEGEPGHTWWAQFHDPLLNDLVARAQRQNITLKIASQRIQAAQAYQRTVASFKVPTLTLGAGYADIRLSENEALMGQAVSGIALPPALGGGTAKLMDRDPTETFVGVNAAWELDLFGRIDSLSQAAAIRAEQAEIMRQGLNTAMTADVISNYLQYRGAEERIAIATKNLREQEETLAMVESLNRTGYGSELDVANARAGLATAKASIPMLETARSVHLSRLAVLLGEPVSQTRGRFTPAPLPSMKALVPTGLPASLLTRRPDIALAERAIAAKNQEVGAAIADRYPKVFLTGAPGLVSGETANLFESGSTTWALGAGVSWNLFDGGRGEAMVKIQEAGLKEAALAYQNQVNSAFNEVETTLIAYGNSLQYSKHLGEANQQAQTALTKAKALYRAGLVNHLSVLDAERQQNSVQDAEIVARLNSATNVVLLHKALGGDWEVPQPAPSQG
ncbi:efflux transporter outer membrane subunit [Aeromonas enteropelogenes]|uniref:efflux transporter outer membrane subunit n=1 Tax=Aeromonas enteropelogenes TaxID=29489 RepID=UPI0038D07803